MRAVSAEIGPDLDPETTVRVITAWTQLFGLVSFELFGQTQGLIHAHDDLFVTTTRSMAASIGLTPGSTTRPRSTQCLQMPHFAAPSDSVSVSAGGDWFLPHRWRATSHVSWRRCRMPGAGEADSPGSRAAPSWSG